MKEIAILLLTTLLSVAWNADAQTLGAAGQAPALSSSSTSLEIPLRH